MGVDMDGRKKKNKFKFFYKHKPTGSDDLTKVTEGMTGGKEVDFMSTSEEEQIQLGVFIGRGTSGRP